VGCSPPAPPLKLNEQDVALLAPAGESTPAAALLRGMAPAARAVRTTHLIEDLSLSRDEHRVVVVPDADRVSGALLSSLLAHSERGGPVLFLGTNPLPTVGGPNVGRWVFAPAGRRYSFFGGEARSLFSGRKLTLRAMRVQSPLPGRRGGSGFPGQGPRWAPFFQVNGEDDWAMGWPASCFVVRSEAGVARCWGWVGADLAEENAPALQTMLAEMVAYLRGGHYFLHAGIDRFWIREGDAIEINGRCVSAAGAEGPVRMSAELADASGSVLRRVNTDPLTPRQLYGLDPARLNLGLAPGLSRETAGYTLRILLEHPESPGEPYDRIEQAIQVSPRDPVAATGSRLTTTGSRFSLDKRAVFLLGVRYEPSAWSARDDEAHWLDPGQFDPYYMERDLARLAGGGINALVIDYRREDQAPQLRCLIREATARNLWLYLSVAGLDPLEPDFALAQRLIDAADLCNERRVFGFELSRRDCFGSAGDRRRYDGEWASWLADQFGSVEHAEAVLGQPVWRDGERVTGPPDAALLEDGPQRTLVAAYRRFLDDLLSSRYGLVRRYLARHGCLQLVSAVNGGGLAPAACADEAPIDPGAGVAHLDFVTLSAEALPGPENLYQEAAFLTAYARGVSGGKPVVWLDTPPRLSGRPDRQQLEEQARIHGLIADMAEKSHAAGWFGLPGVLGPDGLWRPVGDVFRRVAYRQRGLRNVPRVWSGRVLDRDADARGLSALWERWRTVYGDEAAAGEVEEVRPTGFGIPTTKIVPRTLEGMPYDEPAPLQFINGEWGEVLANDVRMVRQSDQTLRVDVRSMLGLTLLNTGPATWSGSVSGRAGTVWVRATRGDRRPQYLRVPTTAFGDTCSIEWMASEVGTWTLRPYLWSHGAFGEPLVVEVLPRRHRMRPGA
jgi:hypothetical protein